jgi:hypothetical protein
VSVKPVTVGLLVLWLLTACRGVTPAEQQSIVRYATEETSELCHYLYFPIADPTASKELKVAHYQAMQDELNKREVVCADTYPSNLMYSWPSMLEKSLD